MNIFKQIINRLPATKIKLFLARWLYVLTHLFCRKDTMTIVRNGIKYQVDLSEGIDLSLFLFGSFQKHISQNRYLSLPRDAVIFDVGANFGTMTLQFAKQFSLGKIYCFEPTFYAFSKLKKNIELNPHLAERIVPVQSFVLSHTNDKPGIDKAYASWKVSGRTEDIVHKLHGGMKKSTEGITAVSLDDFCRRHKIDRLDFIKIDTDGYELDVLKGAEKIIGKFRPVLIFEVGIYTMDERGIDFSTYLEFFDSLSYSLFDSRNYKPINARNYREHIPLKAAIDILATPCSVHPRLSRQTGAAGRLDTDS